MNKKVNISAIKSKMHFIYKDEREKNIAAIVIYNKDGKFFFDPDYKNEMSNLEVEALLLRGALVDRGGKYYRPSSFNENNVSFSDAVINPEDIEVDLSGYATKDELNTKADINDIPIKVSDLQNDSNFLSSIPSEYVTETELNNKGYLTQHQSLDDYATKSYVTSEIANAQLSGGEVDLSEYVTETELNNKGYLTQHQSLDNYATKSYVSDAINAVNGSSVVSPFLGATANFLGDSQTAVNGHKTKVYHEWVKEILGLATVNNYGISGSTIANSNSGKNNPMCNRYSNMDSSADLICVMGGVNDVTFNTPLGQMGDTDPTTFYGAMDTLCKGLYNKYPGKVIIFITPTEQNNSVCNNSNTIGTSVSDYARAMRRVCAKFGIKVFDAHANLGIYPHIASNSSYYTTDGLHFNDAANEKLGRELSNFILYGCQQLVYINDSTPEDPDTPEEPDTPVEPEDPDTPVEPEDPDTPVEPEDPDFVGKQITFTGTRTGYANTSFIITTAVANNSSYVGKTLVAKMHFTNASFDYDLTADNLKIYGGTSDDLSNTSFSGVCSNASSLADKSDGYFELTYSGIKNSDVPYMKIPVTIATTDGSSMVGKTITIDSYEVFIDGNKVTMVNGIGGFFPGETLSLS